MISFIVLLYLILLALGAKSTWGLVQSFTLSALNGDGGLVVVILCFILPFLVIGPIMGIINLGKIIFRKLANK